MTKSLRNVEVGFRIFLALSGLRNSEGDPEGPGAAVGCCVAGYRCSAAGDDGGECEVGGGWWTFSGRCGCGGGLDLGENDM